MKPVARAGNFRQVFGVPTLLALVSAVGLLSALLGDDLWDALSWLMLGAPVAVVVLCVAKPTRRRRA
jgi:hypothetical protein